LVDTAPGTSLPAPAPSRRGRRRTQFLRGRVLGFCRTCHAKLRGRYCHDCGHDSLPPARRLKDLGLDLLDSVFSYTAAAPRTAWALVRHPSEVPSAHRLGDRSRFLSPMKLYVTASLIFFLFLGVAKVAMFQLQFVRTEGAPWVRITDESFLGGGFRINPLWLHRRLDSAPDREVVAALLQASRQQENATEWDRSAMRFIAVTAQDPSEINGVISTWMPRILWLLMPIYGLMLWPLYRRGRLIIEHAILALWAHSLMFLLLVLGAVSNLVGIGHGLVLALGLYQIWFTIGLKGYYRSSWRGAAAKGLVHSVAYIGLLWVPIVIAFIGWRSAAYVPPEWWFE
jgi:hypothetical protein